MEGGGTTSPPSEGGGDEPSVGRDAYVLPTRSEQYPEHDLRIQRGKNPIPAGTLGDVGLATLVEGNERFDEVILVQPFDRAAIVGIDVGTLRPFRFDERLGTLRPVWNSGVTGGLGFVWARIRRPGLYVVLGLPRDRLLHEILRRLATERRRRDGDEDDDKSLTSEAISPLLHVDADVLQELRELLARVEIQTSVEGLSPSDVEMGFGGHPMGFKLPQGVDLAGLQARLRDLDVPVGGLPEEHLFFPPDIPRNSQPPWNVSVGQGQWAGIDGRTMDRLGIWKYDAAVTDRLFPWFLACPDWWMYQHDVRHSGRASGQSDITESTVSGLHLHATAAVDGPVVTKPSIVDGKIYVGSGKSGGVGGTLYKIDLATGAIEGSVPTAGSAFYSWVSGVAGSPAVVGNRVYFTAVHGTVYCVNAATMSPVWSVSLKTSDLAHKQPADNPNCDSWSGPLVVNGRVYVGCGEGESPTTYGFVYCLDAETGSVVWCFCTCKFSPTAQNQPNRIPAAIAAPWATSHGFTVSGNPPESGSAVWSSCAYDAVNDCVYVGTGNSQYPHTAQPDEQYGSGLLALDATTGDFRGFFQPSPADSYWPDDVDIDVPGSPSVYSLTDGRRVVAFGSKNGSFFVLDAADVSNVVARRQLLPRLGGTGLPGDRGTGIGTVVPGPAGVGENMYGVFGTPAIHPGSRRLFVGVGGYNGMHLDTGPGIDPTRTPFLRAMNWDDLHDAWPTAVGSDNVIRYTTTKPPMYTSLEVGLSSPAVVNNVVFVSTGGAVRGLYALSVADGHCLWTAGGFSDGQFVLGPTVYENYVVVGVANTVYIYKLGPTWRFPWKVRYRKPWPWEIVRFGPIGPGPVELEPRPDPWTEPGGPLARGG